jgi:deazaflavin-dependent oxidoreductase (nitroreductase family)
MATPLDTATRFITDSHVFWYRLTGGLVGANVFGAPILLLTTTGRKTGRVRTTPLLYLRDGDDYVVIASYGGSDEDPQWWRNLRANPRAEIQVWSETIPVRARAAQGGERARLWRTITSRYPIYSAYERRTRREIPVVLLSREKAG